MIFVENRKKSKKTLAKLYPNAEVIDLTSRGKEPFVRLSPFYPHGNIPVPFSQNIFAYSVEGFWQALKVFEHQDIDISKFEIQDMKGIKRTVRKFGKALGHRKGIQGTELLDYLTARKQIYLPSYAWLLQNVVVTEVELIKDNALTNDVIFLDFGTNGDIEDLSKPLSHAALVKRFLEKKYPELMLTRFTQPIPKKLRKPRKTSSQKKEKSNNKKPSRGKKKQTTIEGQFTLNLD